MASLKLDVVEGMLDQDAREVNTKFARRGRMHQSRTRAVPLRSAKRAHEDDRVRPSWLGCA